MSDGDSLRAPIGTRDVLPPETARWEALIARFAGIASSAGYGLVQSPMFEDVGVFQRVGEGTDVVRKEMYDFEDKGGRRIALRPEGTASIVRAFVQHRPTTPWKVWYGAPNFRYERPQAGRFRQHHQLGIEALGTADPDLDVEVIALGWDYLTGLGLTRIDLQLNSMGTREDRASFVAHLRDWLHERRGDLDEADRDKIVEHPMRVLDSKRPQTQAVVADAPRITEALSDASLEHFERVQAGLKSLGIAFTRNPRLVRGLDYYTHTTFEFVSDALDAAQSTVLGGGRFDGLVAEMGGPETPGIGFGSGIERVLLACDAEGVFPAPDRSVDVFVVDTTGGHQALVLTAELRRAGIRCDRAFDQRSMRAQMKAADRSGARLAIIVGEREVSEGIVGLRRLRGEVNEGDGAQERVNRAALLGELRNELAETNPTDPPA